MSNGYIDKKFLVIDDFPEFRRLIRRMLESLGIKDIDEDGNGYSVIQKMKAKAYDIILCDYNLGQGKKDGQQILEEAKHRGLIRYSTIFIMLTAENTMPMVMGAVEYQPDDYLIKPITKEILMRRLEKLTKRKADLEAVEKAIRKNEYTHAIALCDELVGTNPKNILEYLRLKSELCITVGRYDEANAVFEEVLSMRDITWAKMGRGKVHFLSGEYLKAQEIFQTITEENKTYMEAYDWLAKALEELGSPEEARQALIMATEISPKAILRHQSIGRISYKIEDYDTAEEAFKSAITIGKNSCFKSPTDYTGLAKALVKKDSSEEALAVLGNARNEFKGDKEALLQTVLTEGIVFKNMNREEEAKKAVQEAAKLSEGLSGKIPVDAAMDMAKACFEMGEKEAGMKFVQNVIRNNHDDNKIVRMVRDVFRDANLEDEGENIIASTRAEILRLNNEGVGLAESGRLEEAIEYFEKALKGFPENKIINANAAQVLMMHMKKNGKDDQRLYKVSQYLDRIKKSDPSFDRYRQLLNMYEQITTSGMELKT
ncbi:MAG: response regulator [Nitrospirae bacterium]|nr:response regulator [Nitrospirota bacterium]